jgi:hypothetical protein
MQRRSEPSRSPWHHLKCGPCRPPVRIAPGLRDLDLPPAGRGSQARKPAANRPRENRNGFPSSDSRAPSVGTLLTRNGATPLQATIPVRKLLPRGRCRAVRPAGEQTRRGLQERHRGASAWPCPLSMPRRSQGCRSARNGRYNPPLQARGSGHCDRGTPPESPARATLMAKPRGQRERRRRQIRFPARAGQRLRRTPQPVSQAGHRRT